MRIIANKAEKQQAHELIDRLRPEQISAVVSLLQFMLLDPVSRAIATAPFDDEPESEEERRSVMETKQWSKNNPGIPFEQVLGDLGLTLEDIKSYQEPK